MLCSRDLKHGPFEVVVDVNVVEVTGQSFRGMGVLLESGRLLMCGHGVLPSGVDLERVQSFGINYI